MTDFYTDAEQVGGRFYKLPSEKGAKFRMQLLAPPEKRPKTFEGMPVLNRKTGEQRYEHILRLQGDIDPTAEGDTGVRLFALNEGHFTTFVKAWKDAGAPKPIEGSWVECKVTDPRSTPTGWDELAFRITPGELPKEADTAVNEDEW